MVPYNPWLSKKYQSHIKLEACMTVKSVKYLLPPCPSATCAWGHQLQGSKNYEWSHCYNFP